MASAHKTDGPIVDVSMGNPDKAGTGETDKEAILKRIHDLSKGSKFYHQQLKKNARTEARISALLSRKLALTSADYERARHETDYFISTLLNSSKSSSGGSEDPSVSPGHIFYSDRTICHIDMDAFFAAVEEIDNPALKQVPMAVGGNSMLSTSNYVARRFGVRSAMPGWIARDLCPQLVIVPHNFSRYQEMSSIVQGVLREFDSDFDMMSMDEAYLDITDYCALAGESASVVVKSLRDRIRVRTGGLTASAGIAPNRMVAKICSDINKPDGQFQIPGKKEAVLDFIRDLEVRKVPGIGKVTAQILQSAALNHIRTCRDLFDNRDLVWLLFSKTAGEFLVRVSMGIGGISSGGHDGGDLSRKSLSCERTFASTTDKEKFAEVLAELAHSVSQDLAKEKLKCRTVTLKFKTDMFDVKTRSRTLKSETDADAEILEVVYSLLEVELPLNLRLLGVRASSLVAQSATKRHKTILDFFGKEHSVNGSPSKGKEKERFPSGAVIVSEDEGVIEILDDDDEKDTDGSEDDTIECPICNRSIRVENGEDSNFRLNQHIDECLNSTALNEPHSSPSGTRRKSQRNWNRKNASKRQSNNTRNQQPSTSNNRRKRRITMDSFVKRQ